jgi:hypothetical protein
MAADVGVMMGGMCKKNKSLSMGVAVQNIGTKMKFNKEEYDLPLNVKAGVSVNPYPPLMIAVDVNKSMDTDLIGNIGAEYQHTISFASVALRAGYKTNTKGIDGVTGITGGIGIGMGNFGFDYAYVPYGDIDTTHRISVQYGF